jgi:hypothetical protein
MIIGLASLPVCCEIPVRLGVFPGPIQAVTTPANDSGQRPPVPLTSGWAITAFAVSFLACTGLGALAAVYCGALAWREINRSNGWLRGKGLVLAAWGIATLQVASVIALVVPPAFSAARTKSEGILRMSYVLVHTRALLAAAEANGDRFPAATNWFFVASPFLVWGLQSNSPSSFHHQTNRLALNAAVAGLRRDEVPADTVVLFELKEPAANAVGGTNLAGAPPGSYVKSLTVGFADGHAAVVRQWETLRWNPR